jgi:hypothetical protein
MNTSTGCTENLRLACFWLNRCLTHHAFCTISTLPSPPLPTRVLDVFTSSTPRGISLINQACSGSYIALSHVWGPQRIITTTKSTLEERMKNIPWEHLSRTFRHAVTIARFLEVRYLWIDSLCIVQDDEDDWANEASNMGRYYMNALITVTAVSSPGGDTGCFMERNSNKLSPTPINIAFPPLRTESHGLVRAGYIRPSVSWDPVDDTRGFQRQPLWQRAWVVQERLLSPRLLLFSHVQMSWRCRSQQASERIPEGNDRFTRHSPEEVLRPVILGLQKFDSMIRDSTINAAAPLIDDQLTSVYNAWYDLVMLYGNCHLTIKSDIFPAISGIAKAIAIATGEEYSAGLWKRDLHRGLLWTAPDSTSSRQDLREYRAPSWSWASLPATCTFRVRELVANNVNTSCFTVENVSIALETANPFGAVLGGNLQIQGVFKKCHPYQGQGLNPTMIDNSEINDSSEGLFDLQSGIIIGKYFADNVDRKYLTEVWCVPVWSEDRYAGEKEAHCLALQLLDKEKWIFMRVGYAWIERFDWFADCCSSLFSIV